MRVEMTEFYRDWINSLKDRAAAREFRCELTGSLTEILVSTER